MASKYILTQLAALQKATLNTDGKRQGSFSELFHAFLDIAEDPDLLNASKPTKDKTIKSALEACARSVTGNETLTVQGLRMMRIASAGFVHGAFFTGGATGTFFYFEKEKQGLVAFDAPGGITHFTRLTMVALPEGALPMPGPPPGSQPS